MKPVHPGQILLEEFLQPRGLSQYRLAKEIQVPLRRINEIVLGRRGISPRYRRASRELLWHRARLLAESPGTV